MPDDATPFVPPRSRRLQTLRRAAADCRGCHLYEPATQTVFGEGAEGARLILLGATAGKALMGSTFKLSAVRGSATESELAPFVTATIHPAAILRAPDDDARQAQRAAFTEDLVFAARALG